MSGTALIDSGASISVLPYSLGVQLEFNWNAETTRIVLTGALAAIEARGVVVEAIVGELPPVRLVLTWANSDQVRFLLGQFNFFQEFDIAFFRSRGIFEIRQPSTSGSS